MGWSAGPYLTKWWIQICWYINKPKYILKYDCKLPFWVNYPEVVIYMYHDILCLRIF